MNISQLPTYYNDAPVEKQMQVMRSYLNTIREELDNSLNNIGYDNLDSELRGKFEELDENLYMVERANSSVASLGNKLQKVLNDYVTSTMLGEAMDQVYDDVIAAVTIIINQVQSSVDSLSRTVGEVQSSVSSLQRSVELIADDVASLKNHAVTDENSETILINKTLKVDKLRAETSVTSPNYYNPS